MFEDNNEPIGCKCSKMFASNQHLTLVFNTFVLMTLFNELNSRKIHDERNIFQGLISNQYFCLIWLATLGAQVESITLTKNIFVYIYLILATLKKVLIVNFGGQAFSCKQLDLIQWGWSFLFGFGTLIWGQVLLKKIFINNNCVTRFYFKRL